MSGQCSFISTDSTKCFDLLNYFSLSKKINVVFTKGENLSSKVKVPLSGASLTKILSLSEFNSRKQFLAHVNLDLSTARSDYSRNDTILNMATKFSVYFIWNNIPISRKSIKKISYLLYDDNVKYITPYLKICIIESSDSFSSFHSLFKMSDFGDKSDLSNVSKSSQEEETKKTKDISKEETEIIQYIRNKYEYFGEDYLIKSALYQWKYFNNKTGQIEPLNKNFLLNLNDLTEKTYSGEKNLSKEIVKLDIGKSKENKPKKYYVVTIAKIKEYPK